MLKFLLALALLPVPLTAHAQKAPLSLGRAVATLGVDFSQLSSIRELNDGRVLLTDFREQNLVVANFATNAVTPLGRKGDGPGEFRRVIPLIPIGHDSSLMANSLERRWVVIDGSMSLSTLPPDAVAVKAADVVYGGDVMGRVVANPSPPPRNGEWLDSTYIVLINVGSGRTDTVGRMQTSGGSATGDKPPPTMRVPYSIYEQVRLAYDGWIVVVRVNPYRVDWRAPDGRWIPGAPIPVTAVKLDAREKQVHLDRYAARLAAAGTAVVNTDSRRGPGPPPLPFGPWPAVVPPITIPAPPLTTMSGEVVIRRTPTADISGPLFDVINRRGVRDYQLLLQSNQRILGFGKGVIYIVTADEDGLEKLSRHRWPLQPRIQQ